MTVLIISSTEDPASTNIKKSLLEQTKWDEINIFYNNPVYRHSQMKNLIIITINDRLVKHENIDKEVEKKLNIKPKQAIYISRHTSKTKRPTLTTHPVGNYGNAELGGKSKTLTLCSPKLMTHLLRVIKKNAKQENLYHKICLEVTHHGPYLEIPVLFAEVGSDETEWKKQKPAEIIAKSLIEVFESYHYEEDFPDNIPVLIGIGGGHYAPRFTDIIFEKKVAFGHMIPAYQIEAGNINNEILEKTIQSTPNLYGAYIHRKSLKKPQIREYKNWFENIGIPVVSSKEFEDL